MIGAVSNTSVENDTAGVEADALSDHESTPAGGAGTPPARPLKRSFSIKGHRTSISLEAAFWSALQEIAAQEASTLAGLVAAIDAERGEAGLSSAVRIWVLEYYRSRSSLPRPD